MLFKWDFNKVGKKASQFEENNDRWSKNGANIMKVIYK